MQIDKKKSKKMLKFGFVEGLGDLVFKELKEFEYNPFLDFDNIYCYITDSINIKDLKNLTLVSRVYLVSQNLKFNPGYISKHKSILGNLIQEVIDFGLGKFSTFSVSAAGSGSEEVGDIIRYIEEVFKLKNREEADLKIYFAKIENTWEIGVQITPRPLSFRAYKVHHMSGAMDPTLAAALNGLCKVDQAKTYMNAFCGSGTLLIEAALSSSSLKHIVGFDNNKKHLSQAVRNIKKANLIEHVKVLYKDIFDISQLGNFDVITADLPFGMQISKDKDLINLYEKFFTFCQKSLNSKGVIGFYTPKRDIIEEIIKNSPFAIRKQIPIKLVTSVNAFLYPVLYICEMEDKKT